MGSKSIRSMNISKSIKAGEPVPEMEMLTTGGGFGFSVTKPEELESTEYTLVTIVIDTSPSVEAFKDSLLQALKDAVKGCQMSGRVDYILLRVVLFNSSLTEVHGFIPVGSVDPDSYKSFRCRDLTALHDAIGEAVDATLIYGEKLRASDYTINACVYIVTDGLNNDSTKYDVDDLAKLFKDAIQGEKVSSLLSVLVGVNSNGRDGGQRIGDILQKLQATVGITQYIDIGNATPKELAKLGGHISKSVSSQSQRVKSGAASQPIPF
jgi:hypothetical protein